MKIGPVLSDINCLENQPLKNKKIKAQHTARLAGRMSRLKVYLT